MRATQTRYGPGLSRGPISPADAGDTSTTTIASRGEIQAGRLRIVEAISEARAGFSSCMATPGLCVSLMHWTGVS